mmetsp:Transcript_22632/g.49549  ORF Transcript_22632/g.49549 Transcript_22632/m.49549 type:complete len:282 (-) Transcript_22632:1073-1918(-)
MTSSRILVLPLHAAPRTTPLACSCWYRRTWTEMYVLPCAATPLVQLQRAKPDTRSTQNSSHESLNMMQPPCALNAAVMQYMQYMQHMQYIQSSLGPCPSFFSSPFLNLSHSAAKPSAVSSATSPSYLLYCRPSSGRLRKYREPAAPTSSSGICRNSITRSSSPSPSSSSPPPPAFLLTPHRKLAGSAPPLAAALDLAAVSCITASARAAAALSSRSRSTSRASGSLLRASTVSPPRASTGLGLQGKFSPLGSLPTAPRALSLMVDRSASTTTSVGIPSTLK